MKSKFLIFCFSFVPGAGQMYQGYMKRGLSLMTLFAVPIVFSALAFDAAIVLTPIIWAYSFFDTFNIARYTPEEKAAKPDKLLLNIEELSQKDLKAVYSKRHRLLGIAGIVFGFMMLYSTFVAPVLWQFYNTYNLVWLAQILNRIPNLVFAVALIFVGFKLIKNNAEKSRQDDIIEYKEDKAND